MDADAGMGGAGAAGDETDAGTAGQLAIGLGHVGGGPLVLADDGVDLRRVVQGVEHVEIAFPRHAEQAVGAMDPQRIDQDASAAARAIFLIAIVFGNSVH